MSDDLLITPGSRKLEIVDTAGNVDAKIETDASGNLKITNAGGDIEIGDTTSDVYIGDGTNSVDIVFEQDGSIRGTSGVVLTLGASGSSVVLATDLSLGGNDLTNIGDLTVTGNLNITGDINSASVTDLDVTDKTITVGAGQNEASSGGSGLIIAGSNAQMLWDEGDNRFEFNKNVYTTGQWQGNGSGLTTLNATNISSGTIADARLSSKVFFGNNSGTITGGSSQSFDDKTANGIHYISNWTGGTGTTNGPSHEGNAYGWGMLRVTQFINDANYVVQEYIPHNDDGAFIRVKWNGSWGPWRQSWTSRSDGANSGLDADKLDAQQGSYYLDYNNFTNTPTIPNVSLYLPLAGGTMSGTLNMGANNITMTNTNITGVNSITINDPGEGIIFTGTNNVTLYAEDDANDNIMKFHNAAALKVGNNHVATSTETTANINSNGTSSTAFVTIYTINGNDLGSSVRLTGKGTTGNVVVNFVADILVNHSGDIYVKSMSGAYTQAEIKITSTNNEDFAIEIRRSGTQSTQSNLKFTCAPLSRSTFITAASSHSFTGASLTHLTNAGTNETSTGGTYQSKSAHNASMPNITLGSQITHDGDTDTYIKFDTNRVRIVDGNGTYLDTNNGTAVLHTSTTFAGDVTGTYGAMVVGNDSHTHSFNNLTGKTSGTADYSTSGYLQAGRGSGGVALTHNDGHGNANVTFNHKAGIPEQNGASLRIETNTDTSGAGLFQFETSTAAVTSGTEVTLTSGMNVSHNYVEIPYQLRHTGNTGNYIQFEADSQKFFTDTTQRLRVDNGGVTINSGTLDMSANNIENVTDIYLADQIIHQGDTNTYMQFHNADEWRVVTGGAERLEVNNTSTKTTGGYFESATMASDKKYRWLRTSGNTYSLEHDATSWYFYNETATRADLKVFNAGTVQIGNGTLEVNSNNKVYHTVNSVGIPTLYGVHVIEATDAQLDLISSNAGTWGSSLNLVEGAGASNTNVWSIARKTASGGNSLNFNFGTSNQHDNAVKAVLESSGDLSLTGKLTITKASTDQQSNADTATIPSTTGAEVLRFHGGYTTGAYATEFAIVDRTGGLPLYVRQSLGTANSFTNIARFGYHAKAEGSAKFAVFGSMQVKDGDLKMYGNVNLYEENDTGANSVHLPRGGMLSLYGNGSLDHSISSRNSSSGVTDDIRISSYGSVYINLDANSNNTSTADFVIGAHNSASNILLKLDGETGAGKGLHVTPTAGGAGVSLINAAQGTVPINQGIVQIRSDGKTGWGIGDEMGGIDWYNSDGSGVGDRTFARMVAVNSQGNGSSTTTFNGELHFYTSTYNAQLNAAPVMRLTENNSVIIGDGTDASSCLQLRPADDGTSDDIQFYNGSTRMGEIGTHDTTWLRINNTTSKNIYTPRYIRADNGFFVDGTAKGINGSGNFIGGTITGASDANVSNWNTAYTVANAALPKAGGTMTGALNTGSNAFGGTSLSVNSSGVTQWGSSRGIMTWDAGYASIYAGSSNVLKLGGHGDQGRITIGDNVISLTSPLTGTTATFIANAAAGTNALNILGAANGLGTGITFSDNGTPAASASGQNGYLTYYHGDGSSYGSGNVFIFSSSEPTTTILADGKLMFKEGIYSKPSTGTGAGTRKDANWDTAYGWGDHSTAGYTPNVGDITAVTAGTGMTGGGTSGAVTLNVIGGSGITANADEIIVDNTVLRTTGAQTKIGHLTIDVDNQSEGALRIEANQTNPEQDFYFAEEIYSTLSGSTVTTADREQGGIYMDINSTATGGGTSHEHRVYGIYADIDSTGDADIVTAGLFTATATPSAGTTSQVVGLEGWAEDNGGAGSTTNIIGMKGTAYSDNATSDANLISGGQFKVYNAADSGPITAARGVQAEIELSASSGDVYGTSYVFEAQYDNNTGAAPTHTAALYYGNYAGTLPTSPYGFYIADVVRNYMGGWISGYLGSISQPTYSFNGDINTGMYSPANHEIGFSVNGTQRLKLNATGADITGTLLANNSVKVTALAATNSAPAGDEVELSGYGLIGNRANLYITNASATGAIVLGVSGAHNANAKLTIGVSTSTFNGSVVIGNNLDVPRYIRHVGDTNTYMDFHAADQWRVVTGGAERLEVNNSYVTVAPTLSVANKIMHTGDTDTYMSFDAADQWKLYCGGYKMIQATEASSGYDYISFGGTDNSGEILFNVNGGDGHFDGNVYAYSTTTSSDRKLKKNIQPLEGALEKVQNLRGVSFEWKKDDKKSIGFIAQEVQEVVPDLVKVNRKEHDGVLVSEHLGVDYGNITALLVEAMKEQQQIINKLEARIKALETGEK